MKKNSLLVIKKKWWELWEKQDCPKLKNENMNYSQFCTLGNEPAKTCRKRKYDPWDTNGWVLFDNRNANHLNEDRKEQLRG